jgi:enamine deaminase RidA (YjgF/YER057c/UK114 family)
MPNDRQLVSSGSHFEPKIGFSRAVRVGQHIWVSGTAPIDAKGLTVAAGDAAAQTRRCFEIVRGALEEAGGSLRDVVRTRVLLVYIEDWAAVAAVHGEVLGDVRPACTVLQVARFIDPGWLVELEVDAFVNTERAKALTPGPSGVPRSDYGSRLALTRGRSGLGS